MWYFIIFLLLAYGLICALLYVYQERFIFLPQVLPDAYKFRFREVFEEVYIENLSENERLHALWFKDKHSIAERVVLYFHGNAGSLADWGGIAEDFVPFGYDVLVLDYRGYGKSRGKMSEKTFFADAQKALAFLKQHYDEHKITIFGRSIGTGIATYLASTCQAERLILETPYYNLPTLVRHHVPFLPAQWLMRYGFRTDKYLPKVSFPVYIFHGTADQTIPYKFGVQVGKFIPKEHLITIEGGNHNDLSTFALYRQALKKIIQAN